MAPHMRFLFIGSRFTLHASSPHPVALMQLRFTSLAVTSLWRDLHLQVCAHAGRTQKSPHARWHRGPVRANCRLVDPMAYAVVMMVIVTHLVRMSFGQSRGKNGKCNNGKPQNLRSEFHCFSLLISLRPNHLTVAILTAVRHFAWTSNKLRSARDVTIDHKIVRPEFYER